MTLRKLASLIVVRIMVQRLYTICILTHIFSNLVISTYNVISYFLLINIINPLCPPRTCYRLSEIICSNNSSTRATECIKPPAHSFLSHPPMLLLYLPSKESIKDPLGHVPFSITIHSVFHHLQSQFSNLTILTYLDDIFLLGLKPN